MCTPAAVRINDNLAASQASISPRATDNELARWVDVIVGVGTIQSQCWLAILQDDLRKSCTDDMLLNLLVHVCHAWRGHLRARVTLDLLRSDSLLRLSMLSRDDNRVDLLRL